MGQAESIRCEEVCHRPSRAEAEEAVKTLIAYIGDDPTRHGVLETPKRVIRAFDELFQGYGKSPSAALGRTFNEVEAYDDIVFLGNIGFNSHCEHHMLPFIGTAHVAYLPAGPVVGLSKLARVVDIYAHRLQTQERMTGQIANAIESTLKPRGVAVMIEGEHSCMSCRGVLKPNARTVTMKFCGEFRSSKTDQERFLTLTRSYRC
jgi:GTP cyclohydrolase I